MKKVYNTLRIGDSGVPIQCYTGDGANRLELVKLNLNTNHRVINVEMVILKGDAGRNNFFLKR